VSAVRTAGVAVGALYHQHTHTHTDVYHSLIILPFATTTAVNVISISASITLFTLLVLFLPVCFPSPTAICHCTTAAAGGIVVAKLWYVEDNCD